MRRVAGRTSATRSRGLHAMLPMYWSAESIPQGAANDSRRNKSRAPGAFGVWCAKGLAQVPRPPCSLRSPATEDELDGEMMEGER